MSTFDYQQFWCEENAYRLLGKVQVMQNLNNQTGRDTMKGWTCEASYAMFVSSFHCPVDKQPLRSWPEAMLPIAVQELAVDSSVKSAMVWDYHVICALLMKPMPTEENKDPEATWWAYDHDTKVSAPLGSPFGKNCIPLEYYVRTSFLEWKDREVPEPHTLEEFTKHTADKLRIRLVPAADFLAGFSSDRSHMMNLMQPKTAAGQINWMSPPPKWPLIQKQEGIPMNLAWYINMDNVKEAHKEKKAKDLAPHGVVMPVSEIFGYLSEKHASK